MIMTRKEILTTELTRFLKEHSVYEDYIEGLAVVGSNGKTIEEITEWCIASDAEAEIIDYSFGWHRVSLGDNDYSWEELHYKFRDYYESLSIEDYDYDPQWADMWDN